MAGVNILSDEQYRLLTFVSACNGSSYNPTAREVMLWRQNPEPAKAEYRTVEVEPPLARLAGIAGLNMGNFAGLGDLTQAGSSFQRMLDATISKQMRGVQESIAGIASRHLTQPTTRRELIKEAESIIDHLIRLTWLETVSVSGIGGLRLTGLGRALLRDHEKDGVTQPDVSVVVLESNDPLAYPLLVGQLAEAGEGLLIDPYLKIDNLHRIVISTRLTRLLVSGRHNGPEIAAMQTYLDSKSLPRHIEVRSSTELHDRILLSDDGAVLTLGTSLNSIGRTTTVLTPMPSGTDDFLRETYERIWGNGALVGPQPVEPEADDDENAGSKPESDEDETDTNAADGDQQETEEPETKTDTDGKGDSE